MLLRIAQAVLAFIGGSVPIYFGSKNGWIIGLSGMLFAYICTVWYVKISDWRQNPARTFRRLDAEP